jgi:ATP-dependent exoDNAse (exonuclease V) alpha subunit
VNEITVTIEGTSTIQAIKKYGFPSTDNKDTVLTMTQIFPLKLCTAITVHKSEGCTIQSTVFIEITDAFSPGLVYVALSRVTNRYNIKLLSRLTPDIFIPVVIPLYE